MPSVFFWKNCYCQTSTAQPCQEAIYVCGRRAGIPEGLCHQAAAPKGVYSPGAALTGSIRSCRIVATYWWHDRIELGRMPQFAQALSGSGKLFQEAQILFLKQL